MLQGVNSTGKAVAKTKLADIKSKNARACLANITMLFPPDTTWRRGWSYVQHWGAMASVLPSTGSTLAYCKSAFSRMVVFSTRLRGGT